MHCLKIEQLYQNRTVIFPHNWVIVLTFRANSKAIQQYIRHKASMEDSGMEIAY